MALVNPVSSTPMPLVNTAVSQIPGRHKERVVARAFLETFVLALLMVWSPSNALGYLAPFVTLVWYIWRTRSSTALVRGLAWFVGWGLTIALNAALRPDFALLSALLATVTYSSFLALLVIRPRQLASAELWESVQRILRWVVTIEGSLGIVQAAYGFTQTGSFYGPNGDYVEGTIHPWLRAELAFSNPMFAVNMTFILLTLLPAWAARGKGWLALGIGGTALILASVLHVFYLVSIGLVVAAAVIYPSIIGKKVGVALAIVGLIAALVTARLVGIRPEAAVNLWTLNLQERTPRGLVIGYALDEMPTQYPLMPLIGVGPGQFSSRAGLIATGYYFGRPERPRTAPFLPTSMSPAFRDYVLFAWLDFARAPGITGSSTQPYFSWLSVYVEFGGLMFAAILLVVVASLFHLRRLAITPIAKLHALGLGSSMVFLFMLGIQENYWEISQAIYSGILLMLVQYGRLRCLYRQVQPSPALTLPRTKPILKTDVELIRHASDAC
jgi:hypothetical protein